LPGKRGDTIELEAFYVPNDTAYGLLKTAYDNGELIVVRRSEDGVSVEEASAWIGSISRNAPDGEAATVTISLTLNEDWTAVV
jgi:hypothetical protein